jgi:hypothetical protein
MKEEIYKIIRNDPTLRKLIGDELDVIESTVYGHAVRKAPILERYTVIKIIMAHTGLKEEEILTKAKV